MLLGGAAMGGCRVEYKGGLLLTWKETSYEDPDLEFCNIGFFGLPTNS